jgi:hypothetical protein
VITKKRIVLTDPQYDFIFSNAQFPALVAGFGSGKTHALLNRNLKNKISYPRNNVAYYLPTFDLVKKIAFPRYSEMLEELGLPFRLNKTDAEISIEDHGKVIFRTLDTPHRIIGYEVGDSDVDELDTLPTHQARDAWNKIIARNRQKKPDGSLNTVGIGTTPEGFKFVYDMWERNKPAGYELIRASTYSNIDNLPAGYIESLKEIYPTNLLAAYLDGHFVNLTSGSVYVDFDRKLNASNETIKENDQLHVGMDFNVGKMAAVINVLRDDKPHAVGEITGVLDTPAMIVALKNRYPDRKIIVYPDASGDSRRSNNASESDLALLKQAKFSVFVNQSNPAVKDRVLSVNLRIKNAAGERKMFINVDRCPHLVEALEKQCYDKNGEPDKTSGLDHIIDAQGYFVCYRYPIKSRGVSTVTVIGL